MLAIEANYALQQHYTKGSVDRQKLQDAIAALKKKGAVQVPLAIGGEHVRIEGASFTLSAVLTRLRSTTPPSSLRTTPPRTPM